MKELCKLAREKKNEQKLPVSESKQRMQNNYRFFGNHSSLVNRKLTFDNNLQACLQKNMSSYWYFIDITKFK